MTNADCIRDMNDEELARFLDEVQRKECEALHEMSPDGSLKFNSRQYGWLLWLQAEERTLDFSVKYTEICVLYNFCVDLGIKCTIERLYDGYAVRFPDGSDFAQHHATYGGTEGCVEPAIGDPEFDYTAVGLNLAKELVKKHKGKLEVHDA
nr:MAG TPA: Histidine phosphotransferase C-terminal domain [Bacteriophage sp.]